MKWKGLLGMVMVMVGGLLVCPWALLVPVSFEKDFYFWVVGMFLLSYGGMLIGEGSR